MAIIGRPDLATFTSLGTSPPTPAMQDISARLARSSAIATSLLVCAALEHPEQEYTSGNFERSTGEACVLISASPLNNYFLSHYRKRRHCRKNRQCPLHALRVNCQLGGKIAQVNPSLFRLRPDWIHAIQPGGIAAQYHVLLFGADVTASENVVDPDLGLRESIHS